MLERGRFNPLLPWIWFWLVFYVLNTPARFDNWYQTWNTTVSLISRRTDIIGTNLSPLLGLPSVVEIVPSVALFLGALTIFLPGIRAALLKWQYSLIEPPEIPAISEIQGFLLTYAPTIKIIFSLKPGVLAFVYPTGYRTTAIAIFSGLIKLWRSDRSAAEAVLLHEIAHHVHGDTLVVGTGSFFEIVVRYWLPLCLTFVFIPNLLVTADQSMNSFQKGIALGIPISSLLYHEAIALLTITLPSLLLMIVVIIPSWFINIFVLPLAGIWCAELYADRFVIEAKKSSGTLVLALEKLPSEASWWRWLLSQTSHPPTKLRKRLALRSQNGSAGLIFLVFIFPLAYFAKLLALLPWAIGQYVSMYIDNLAGSVGTILNALVENIGLFFGGLAQTWLSMGILFLIWPIAVGYWERFFCGQKQTYNLASYGIYFLSAMIVGTLYIFSA